MSMSRKESGPSANDDRMKKRRTRRACDRCRLKKAKCDGAPRCQTCKTSGSRCLYTARRGREARSYYYQMREVLDEALQQLYWACRRKCDFPGDIPDETSGKVTTDAIIRGLGLVKPSLREAASAQSSLKQHDQAAPQPQIIPPPAEPDYSETHYPSGSQSSFVMSPSSYGKGSSFSPPMQSPSLLAAQGNRNMDMPPRTVHMPPRSWIGDSKPLADGPEPVLEDASRPPNADSLLEAHTFLDTSSGAISTGFNTFDNLADTMQWHARPVEQIYISLSPDPSAFQGALSENYLTSWPGPLATAFYSIARV